VIDWRDLAACRGHPSRWWWFSADPTAVELARRVCSACPVAGPCLAEALAEEAESPWRYGLRAGMTPAQRSSLRRTSA
jgi:hypothetical protein